ncbi:YkuS family protein [Metallumcola ferriviriculae]|uniref:YkuS family protein n=1 Tax=Metallumcola ferriviriculae TaxID=3039180 RepID=A0AAU0UJ79_9FIRM|nr:YkuS family protein [Desulfitibacteraceae bacterium MK1]
MKRIIVQEGLEEIKAELDNRGFETISGEGNVDAAAVIYSGVSCDWEGTPTVTNDWVQGSETPLLINAVGMTADEAADLIVSRVGDN